MTVAGVIGRIKIAEPRIDPNSKPTLKPRSTEMYTVHEALARDRIREREQRSREAYVGSELAAQRRWHRVSRFARSAESRHAVRVHQTAGR